MLEHMDKDMDTWSKVQQSFELSSVLLEGHAEGYKMGLGPGLGSAHREQCAAIGRNCRRRDKHHVGVLHALHGAESRRGDGDCLALRRSDAEHAAAGADLQGSDRRFCHLKDVHITSQLHKKPDLAWQNLDNGPRGTHQTRGL